MRGGSYFRFKSSLQQGTDGPFLNPVQELVGLEPGVTPAWISPALISRSPGNNDGIFKRKDPLPSNEPRNLSGINLQWCNSSQLQAWVLLAGSRVLHPASSQPAAI